MLFYSSLSEVVLQNRTYWTDSYRINTSKVSSDTPLPIHPKLSPVEVNASKNVQRESKAMDYILQAIMMNKVETRQSYSAERKEGGGAKNK